MVRKNRRITTGRHTALWGLAAAICMMAALWNQSFVSLADSTGTVIPGSVNIREKADGSSAVVGSASAGTTVNIRDEAQDSSGTLWYQVDVDANKTGYIRADLIDKKDGGSTDASASSGGASGAAVEAENAIDAQYATVAIEAIKVRKAPSTSEGVVDRLVKDTQVIISGQSNGSDGKLWYFANFTGTDGAEKTGFIRSDLLTLGDMVPGEEEPDQPEQPEPEPEPEKPVNNDYELTYEEENGTYEWYLYDYTEGEHGGRQKLKNLLEAAQSKQEGTETDAKTLVKQRIAIVVLAVLLVILTITVIVMAVKLRDAYYEDYDEDEDEDDEEEDDEDDEEMPVSRRRRTQEEPQAARRRRSAEEETAPVRRRRTQEEEVQPERAARRKPPVRDERRGAVREVTYQDDGAGNIAVSAPPKRKAKNFLLDDDDFEFEFLNMDDKDL